MRRCSSSLRPLYPSCHLSVASRRALVYVPDREGKCTVLVGWLVLGRKPVSGKMPRIEAKVGYDCPLDASAASGIQAVQLRRIECLERFGIACQIAPALDPPLVQAGSATQGLASPLGQGAGEARTSPAPKLSYSPTGLSSGSSTRRWPRALATACKLRNVAFPLRHQFR